MEGRLLRETDLKLRDGRTLHTYDSGENGPDSLTVVWHHGTPNIGRPPEPLFPAGARLGIRWVSYDRPGYGGSTPCPDRKLASAASYASSIADAMGIEHVVRVVDGLADGTGTDRYGLAPLLGRMLHEGTSFGPGG